MRKAVTGVLALAMAVGLAWAAGSATTGTKSKPAPRKTAAAKTARKTARKTTAKRSAPPRQMAPTTERYKEIQQALAAKGYLPAEQANGQWTDASSAALKRFQADQNIDATGRINSLSLIALGLGPKHETAAPVAQP
jgi:peptidoglycan hydrolase-like protein with peptidoglycan-binding domain